MPLDFLSGDSCHMEEVFVYLFIYHFCKGTGKRVHDAGVTFCDIRAVKILLVSRAEIPRYRPGLEHVQCVPLETPFDILRNAEEILYVSSEPDQSLYLCFIKRLRDALF